MRFVQGLALVGVSLTLLGLALAMTAAYVPVILFRRVRAS